MPEIAKFLIFNNETAYLFLLPLALIYIYAGMSQWKLWLLACMVYYISHLYLMDEELSAKILFKMNFINMSLILSFALLLYISLYDPRFKYFGMATVPIYMFINNLLLNVNLLFLMSID